MIASTETEFCPCSCWECRVANRGGCGTAFCRCPAVHYVSVTHTSSNYYEIDDEREPTEEKELSPMVPLWARITGRSPDQPKLRAQRLLVLRRPPPPPRYHRRLRPRGLRNQLTRTPCP